MMWVVFIQFSDELPHLAEKEKYKQKVLYNNSFLFKFFSALRTLGQTTNNFLFLDLIKKVPLLLRVSFQ